MTFVFEFDLMFQSWVCYLISLWHSSFSGFVVNVLGLLFSSVGLLFDLSMAYFILWIC